MITLSQIKPKSENFLLEIFHFARCCSIHWFFLFNWLCNVQTR